MKVDYESTPSALAGGAGSVLFMHEITAYAERAVGFITMGNEFRRLNQGIMKGSICYGNVER